jgi:hypothetical protein
VVMEPCELRLVLLFIVVLLVVHTYLVDLVKCVVIPHCCDLLCAHLCAVTGPLCPGGI